MGQKKGVRTEAVHLSVCSPVCRHGRAPEMTAWKIYILHLLKRFTIVWCGIVLLANLKVSTALVPSTRREFEQQL